jgi:hypothetical protein
LQYCGDRCLDDQRARVPLDQTHPRSFAQREEQVRRVPRLKDVGDRMLDVEREIDVGTLSLTARNELHPCRHTLMLVRERNPLPAASHPAQVKRRSVNAVRYVDLQPDWDVLGVGPGCESDLLWSHLAVQALEPAEWRQLLMYLPSIVTGSPTAKVSCRASCSLIPSDVRGNENVQFTRNVLPRLTIG